MRHAIKLMILMTLAYGFSCQSKQESSQADEKLVKAVQIANEVGEGKLKVNGEIKEKKEAMLSFRVGGPLHQMKVKQGDFVKKGQLLAEIDPRDYQIQVKQNKAQYDQVKGEYERYKQLFEKGKLPENSYQKIKSGYELATVAYDHSKNQLRDTRLVAPFSGYVSAKFVNNFETVGPGVPVISIIDVQAMDVIVKVPSSRISLISEDVMAEAEIPSAGLKSLPLEFVSVGQKSGMDDLYEVKFSFADDNNEQLKSGMLASVNIKLPAKDVEYIHLPVESILRESGKDYVWTVQENGSVKKIEVNLIGLANGGKVKLSSNQLKANSWVVTAGVNALLEGQKVKVLENASSTNVGGLL
ncbi:RND transporter [Aureibacter tunicatorum]|nr:RND transporter [Aureibacter tunicatorum]